MPVTRDPNYPAEAANLMQAFNEVADGFNSQTVLNASMNMVVAGIGYQAKANGLQLQQALDYADLISSVIRATVMDNWDRKPAPTDVEVNLRNARAL
jgi:hypothetical protein